MGRGGRRWRWGLGLLLAAGGVAGCGLPVETSRKAYLAPEELASPRASETWIPPAEPEDEALEPDRDASAPRATLEAGATYDLATLIDLSLTNNPSTREAWEAARARAAVFGETLGGYLPSIDFEAQAGYSKYQFEAPGDPAVIKQYAVTPLLNLEWVLFDFGRRPAAVEEARRRLLAANLDFNRALQEVLFDVQTAYYALDAARGMVRAAERNRTSADAVLAAAAERLRRGLSTRPDVLLAEQASAKASYELEAARVFVSDGEARLALAIGAPANQPIEIEPIEEIPPGLDESVDALIDEALSERPDLAARVEDLRAREAATREARADFYPLLYAQGSYGLDAWWYQFSAPPTVRSDTPVWNAGLGLRWPLFEGFARDNRLREAEAEEAQARAALDQAELDTIADVWRAFYDQRAAAKKYEYAGVLLSSSREAYASNLESYQRGLATIVDLLTAEGALAEARYIQIQSRAELLTQAARLAYVVGSGRPEARP